MSLSDCVQCLIKLCQGLAEVCKGLINPAGKHVMQASRSEANQIQSAGCLHGRPHVWLHIRAAQGKLPPDPAGSSSLMVLQRCLTCPNADKLPPGCDGWYCSQAQAAGQLCSQQWPHSDCSACRQKMMRFPSGQFNVSEERWAGKLNCTCLGDFVICGKRGANVRPKSILLILFDA